MMFDKERFIQDCVNAVPEGQEAIRETLEASVVRQLSLPDGARETSLWLRAAPAN